MKNLLVYIITMTGSLILLGLIFLAPYLKSLSDPAADLIYSLFSPLCHQIPSRSFAIYGFPLAVCARCLGIYLGFFLGTLIHPLISGFRNREVPSRAYLIFFSLPIIIDTAANFLRFWNTPGWIRLILGIVWGGILPFYFIAGINELVNRNKNKLSSLDIS
ncbi:MAG: DUF2085 domain-containing protein [Candidatus Aminicenantes bacterium]|nr:DUF2085 domain-containing protein [Candidatus Aminicenantes bacterium]